jgi:hypothetical protein
MKHPEKRDDIEADAEAHKRELIEPAATLFAVQRVHGDKVREQTMKAYGRLVDAHLLITGALAAVLLRDNGKIRPVTPTSEERNALFASFVIGMEACENAIAEGRYLQASALLRQEMETLAQLKAVRAGRRNENQSPNVAVVESSLRRLYGELSAAAHISKHDVVRAATKWVPSGDDLPGPTSGTRYFPVCDESRARRSFGLHLMLIVWVISELSIDLYERHNGDGFTEREDKAIKLAQILMQAEGIIEIDRVDLESQHEAKRAAKPDSES